MKKGWQAPGYTIVEVMIFLAVSSALLISGLSLVAGQQRKAEFNQAIRDVEQQIQDVINNVRIGYYPSQGTFRCQAVAVLPAGLGVTIDVPLPPATPPAAGENVDCVFLGRAIQFNTTPAEKSQFSVHSIAGLREYTKGRPSPPLPLPQLTSIQRADPTHIDNAKETKTLKYGLETVRVKYTGDNDLGSVGFLTEPGKTDLAGKPMSGTQTVRLVPINNTSGNTGSGTGSALDNYANYSTQDPSGGVTICFKSGGTNQYGIITIGGSAGQLNTKLDIKNPSPMPTECT